MYQSEPDFQHLKKLWTLKMVAELGSLKRAALQSKVSVSAVSQSLSNLEKDLGRKLVVRKDREIQPTEFARSLLAAAEPAFLACQKLDPQSVCAISAPTMSWLNFGITDAAACDITSRFVQAMRTKMPKLKLTLRIARGHSLIQMVRSGNLCMAVVADPGDLAGLSVYPLYEDQLGIFARSDAAEDEFESGLAALAPGPEGHPAYFSRYLRALGKVKPTLASDSYEVLYGLATSGAMPAILPRRLAQRAPGVLKEIPMPLVKPGVGSFSVVMISEQACDPREDAFLLQELKSLF